jgi:hypothetical protein
VQTALGRFRRFDVLVAPVHVALLDRPTPDGVRIDMKLHKLESFCMILLIPA